MELGIRLSISVLFGTLIFTSCTVFPKVNHRDEIFSQVLADIWQRDTCGFIDGERAAVAKIYNSYLNKCHWKPTLQSFESIFGRPDETREFSNGLTNWYYFIGVEKCDSTRTVSPFVLSIIFHKNHKKVSGSAIFILEPEDN